ncbi:hypothetical protein OROHE_011684 [Orobanche hederae]
MARILFFKIRPSQEILKIRDVARILVFKIRPSQEILKIHDGNPLEAEGIFTYRKSPRNCSVWHFSSKLDVPSNIVQKKRVARILVFKIRPSQEIQKIRDGTHLEVEGILTYRKKPSKLPEILKIRDGTHLDAEEFLTYIKNPRNCSVWHFSSKLGVPNNLIQNKRVARILFFKIRPSQEILKIRDGTPLEKKRVARILVFKIRPSQEIQKIRDGTPLEVEGILTYRKKPSKLPDGINFDIQKKPRNRSVWRFSSKLDVPSNVVQKKRVARILVFKIRPSQEIQKIRDGTPFGGGRNFDIQKKPSKLPEILKIRDGTPLESGRNFDIQKKAPRNCSVWHFSSKLDVPSNVVQKKRVARILFFKIMPSQEILKIRDGNPLEAEGILTYRKSPRNCSVWHFSSKLGVPNNIVQKKRVARILVFKIRPSQEIQKIRDGTHLEVEGILTYRKKPSKLPEILKIHDGNPLEAEGILTYRKSPETARVARILVFKIRPSQEIQKIRDGTHLEVEGILTYRKKPSKLPEKGPRNCSVWHFSSKLDVPSNVVQKKRVARILFFKIMPSQEILKIRDGNPLEAEGILTYRKSPRNCSVWHFSSKLDVPSNIVQKKRVARILVFKIRPSQEIQKIRDGTHLEVEGILTYRKKPSKLSGLALF